MAFGFARFGNSPVGCAGMAFDRITRHLPLSVIETCGAGSDARWNRLPSCVPASCADANIAGRPNMASDTVAETASKCFIPNGPFTVLLHGSIACFVSAAVGATYLLRYQHIRSDAAPDVFSAFLSVSGILWPTRFLQAFHCCHDYDEKKFLFLQNILARDRNISQLSGKK